MSTVEGEAWALLHSMKEANHRGLDRVQFESDSQVLIEAIRTRHKGISKFSLIVADIIQNPNYVILCKL
jgi:ribonuclease HI